jgi:hypothetical protein
MHVPLLQVLLSQVLLMMTLAAQRLTSAGMSCSRVPLPMDASEASRLLSWAGVLARATKCTRLL